VASRPRLQHAFLRGVVLSKAGIARYFAPQSRPELRHHISCRRSPSVFSACAKRTSSAARSHPDSPYRKTRTGGHHHHLATRQHGSGLLGSGSGLPVAERPRSMARGHRIIHTAGRYRESIASRGSPLRSRKPSHSPTPFPSKRCKDSHVQDRCPPKRLPPKCGQALRQRKHASRQQKVRKRHAQSWVPVERRQKQAKSAREQQDFK
jgi:hypothetical protein